MTFARLVFPVVAAFALIGAAAHAQTTAVQGNTVVAIPPPGPPPVARQGWNTITPYGDVQETLAASGQFTYFLNALKATKLDKSLKKKKKGAPEVTLLAPTDTAFAKLPPGELQALFADKARLKRLVGYHIVPSAVTSAELRSAGGETTSEGAPVTFQATPRRMAVNEAVVLQADVAASNGAIVVIDKVLTPPPAPTASAG
jgi:uncharacterized surface protein with fasciclin (FAS1) repeats